MKTILYAVCGTGGWRAVVSLAWEVDRRYWTDAAFRAGAAAGWGDGDPGGMGRLVRVREPLPLGIAEAVCSRWVELAVSFEVEQVSAALREAVKQAAVAAGEKEMSKWAGVATEEVGEYSGAGGSDAYGEGQAMGAMAREVSGRLGGKALLEAEAAVLLGQDAKSLAPGVQLAALLGGVRLEAGVAPDDAVRRRGVVRFRCRRCGSGEAQLRRTPCASCGRLCAYCEACLTMGRSRECGLLIAGLPTGGIAIAPGAVVSPAELAARWGLSPAQSAAASSALAFLLKRDEPIHRGFRALWAKWLRLGMSGDRRTFLLWAVTGAGKTEMVFPLFESVLSRGGYAAVASPRRDVILELAPRLANAFPHTRLAVLYGGSQDRFERGGLTLATTHQLIRFRGAFDLVIVDEVDAFPYHNDPMLHYAAQQSRAPSGVTVLLSATPPHGLQKQAESGQLPHARVPVRHHGRPLPIPSRLSVPPLSKWLGKRQIPPPLLKAIRVSADRGAQLFLFVPSINQVEPLVRCLRDQAPAVGITPEAIGGTSSQDPDRGEKVAAFRQRSLRLLVTTTILERGVTIPKSDVLVLDADKPIFDASSLVQMAGRAGRSADDPDGLVRFAAPHWTKSQRDACRQIRGMNRTAARNGYLKRQVGEQ